MHFAQQPVVDYTDIFDPSSIGSPRADSTRIHTLPLPHSQGKGVDQSVIGFLASMASFSPFADSLTPANVGSFGDIGDGPYQFNLKRDSDTEPLLPISMKCGRSEARSHRTAASTQAGSCGLDIDALMLAASSQASA